MPETPTTPIMAQAVKEILANFNPRDPKHDAGLTILVNIQMYLVCYEKYSGPEYQHHVHSNWIMDNLEENNGSNSSD